MIFKNRRLSEIQLAARADLFAHHTESVSRHAAGRLQWRRPTLRRPAYSQNRRDSETLETRQQTVEDMTRIRRLTDSDMADHFIARRITGRRASEEENERAKYNDFTAPRFFGRMHDFGCRK